MDATHGPDRGFDPFVLFVANLLRTIRPENGHKRRKGRWARTRLKVASIDAAEISGRAPRKGGLLTKARTILLRGRKHLGLSPRLGGSRTSAPAASMDATHGPGRAFDPFAPFVANLCWPIGPEDGHKRLKGPLGPDWTHEGVYRRRGGFRASARKGGIRSKALRDSGADGCAVESTFGSSPGFDSSRD